VPVVERLALLLADHRVLTNQADGLLFPHAHRPTEPIGHDTLRTRMRTQWDAAGMNRLGFHEARHTFASLMIAAGVNAKALSTYMGHATIGITFDRYGHLFPGNEAQAAGLLNAYLLAQE
jgi:integrase